MAVILKSLKDDIPPDEPRIILGTNPTSVLRMLRSFYEFGRDLDRGAGSMRSVAGLMEERSFANRLSRGIGSSATTLSRRKKDAEIYFRDLYHVREDESLFVCRGTGWPITGLTMFGHRAWKLTRKYLFDQGIVEEIA